MPKVSVIMGIYNTNNKNMVKLAIDSILTQTYSDFEFIICDDGSNDGTYELVKLLTEHDARVILIKNKTNLGLAATLNNCLSIAKGEYIARMDADDISLPTRLKEEIFFLDNNSEYALVGCNAELINDKGVWGRRNMPKIIKKRDFLFTSPFIHPTILMRKKIYDLLNGYKVSKITSRPAEDYELFMRLYTLGYKGYNLQQYLFQYREDKNAYKKRAYKFRFHEAKLRYEGFKKLGLLPYGFIYVLKPLIVGLVPQSVLAIIRREKNIKE